MAKTDSVSGDARDLVDLVVGYAKQETVDPLRRLGKTIAFGVIGAVLVGLGVVFLALAGLRALQTETATFDGNWSLAPYGIAMAVLGIGALAAWKGLGPGSKKGDHS